MSKNTWFVKNLKGQVLGPYSDEEIIEKIRVGFFLGEEMISSTSDAGWLPITKKSQFFDALIDVLDPVQEKAGEELEDLSIVDASDDKKEDSVVEPKWKKIAKQLEEKERRALEKAKKQGQVQRSGQTNSNEKDLGEYLRPSGETQLTGDMYTQRGLPRPPVEPPKASTGDFSAKLRLLLFSVATVAAAMIAIVFFSPKAPKGEHIRLLQVDFASAGESDEGSQALLSNALSRFRRHTINDYLATQDLLVKTLEKNGRSLDAMEFLCVTYKELWPHTYKDSYDINAIYRVFKKASIVRANSTAAGVCYVIYQWVVGEYAKAENYMNDALRREPSLMFFNQLTGDLLEQKKNYMTAVYYFEKVKQLWPQTPWLKPILQEARTYRKLKQYDRALQSYVEALKSFPKHRHVLLELGILEYEAFQHRDKAKRLILKAFQSKDRFDVGARAEALYTLSRISLETGNKAQALRYANQSFALDSGNAQVKKFIIDLGGRSALDSIRLDSSNMLYLGTQYMKVRNYFAAQAEFRAAYEADPKNALAAYYAGRAFWHLNQSKEASKWVERAIKADPGLISAYVTLAEYHARRHDYEGAASILKNIRRRFPKNNEIYRGFAFIEYHRGNSAAAIQFAQRALSLYPMDTEALQILVKTYIGLEDFLSASQYVERTLEVDPHTPEVHALYGRTLAGLHGASSGVEYLQSRIEESPTILIYKKVLADIYLDDGNWSGARAVLETLLLAKSDDKETLMKLADTYKKEGFFNRALEKFLMAASLDPLDPEPLFEAGILYLESGDGESAISQFERVLKINKNFPKVYYYLGRASMKKKDYSRVIAMADMEKRVNPNIADPYILAAEAHKKLQQYNECAGEYQKAILRRPQGSGIYINMGRCYRLAGALDSALSMLNQASQRESGNPVIYKELGQVYHLQGLFAEAHQAYARYLSLAPNAPDRRVIVNKMRELK